MLSHDDLLALGLSLKLATVTVIALLMVSTPLAWWLARSKSRYKVIFEALVALPLVLPPTVIGFYLLLLLGANGPLGRFAFSFPGLVFGSMVYSLPFVVQPLQQAFAAMGNRAWEAAATLRATPWQRFWSVAVPMARPGFLTAAVLGFAHTLGEFGVVLMIGGSIPGSTKVASIAIYEHVEASDYGSAHALAATMLVLAFGLLLVVFFLHRRRGGGKS